MRSDHPLLSTGGAVFGGSLFIPILPAGITSIGVCGKDSVCVVTQKKNIPDTDSQVINRTHFVPVTKYLAFLITCPTYHVTKVASSARREVYSFRIRNGYEITVDDLAIWIYRHVIHRKLRVTNSRMVSSFCTVAMVFGIDVEKGPRLFKSVCPDHFSAHKATSIGLKEQEEISFLEKVMKNDSATLSYEETVQVAISALKSILQQDFKAAEIEVGVVRADNPDLMVLSAKEIDEHLTAISERKKECTVAPPVEAVLVSG